MPTQEEGSARQRSLAFPDRVTQESRCSSKPGTGQPDQVIASRAGHQDPSQIGAQEIADLMENKSDA